MRLSALLPVLRLSLSLILDGAYLTARAGAADHLHHNGELHGGILHNIHMPPQP
jgi:hypothetical protein